MSKVFVMDVEFSTEQCIECGMPFAVTSAFQRERKNDHKEFCCPWGHNQYYSVESDLEKTIRQRNDLSKKADLLQRCCTEAQTEANELQRKIPLIRAGYKGQIARIKKGRRS